jgi:hypothetical protein
MCVKPSHRFTKIARKIEREDWTIEDSKMY